MSLFKFVAAVALAASGTSAVASVAYNFDSSASGWVGTGGLPAFTYQSTGGVGNTGYIQTIDMAGGQMAVTSPALGNLSSTFGGALSFNYNVFALLTDNTYVPNTGFGTVTISSGGSFVVADLIAPVTSNIAGSGWLFTSLGLTDALWNGNALLSTVLQNVTGISIVTEYNSSQRYPDESVGIDNVALADRVVPPINVPEPEMLSLLLIGLVGTALVSSRKAR